MGVQNHLFCSFLGFLIHQLSINYLDSIVTKCCNVRTLRNKSFRALEEAVKNLLPLIPVFLIFLFVPPAEAQTENMLGIYFDEEGQVNCVEDLPSFSNIYVVLHNPTVDFIVGIDFEIVLSDVVGDLIYLNNYWYPGVILDVCDPMGHACAAFAEPYPLSFSTPITSYMTYSIESPLVEICFNLQGAMMAPDPDFPTLYTAFDPTEYLIASVDPGPGGGCVARVGSCVVANKKLSFGTIKALYRN